MRKLFLTALLVACAAPAAFAQDDYNKYDFYVGYSHNRVDVGIDDEDTDVDDIFDEREGFNGINVSAKGNFHRYVGAKADYAYHRKGFDVLGVNVNTSLHTLVGGVEFKDNAKETKVKPFAHLMAGFAHSRADFEDINDDDITDNGFAGVIGGGVDFRLSDRVDFRAIQFDYNPTHGNGNTSHNFRIGVGLVFR
jgi:opacity protein-like surface antigen